MTQEHQKRFTAYGILIALIGILALAQTVFAHQPVVPTQAADIEVQDPTVSKAFYAELVGNPATYHIESGVAFDLYLNILVPDIAGVTKDYTLTVTKDGQPFTEIDPGATPWKIFDEPFGGDRYLQGPEYRSRVDPGDYDVTVSSPDNRGKYVLAIGEKESFPFGEIIRTLKTMPEVKRYFGKPTIAIFQSPFIYVPTISFLVVAGLIIWAVRWRRGRVKGRPNRSELESSQ